MPEFPNEEGVEAQFSRLIRELLSENMHRATFQPWEIEILLGIESCDLSGPSKRRILTGYEKAMRLHFETGARLPFKLSEYLESLRAARKAALSLRKPAAAEHRTSRKSKRVRRSRKG
jgi:hypothetical protein